ncbi:MAG: hypothetical protein NVS2B12_17170 [Ktedonobacteraceae bacterium]
MTVRAAVVHAEGAAGNRVLESKEKSGGRSDMMKTANNQQPKRPKHQPLRTCIACRDTKTKRELLRVVRTPDGHVLIDATGKKSGRGAYLCAKLSCWQKALKEKRLEQQFEIEISAEDRKGLDEYIATLPQDAVLPAQPNATRAGSSRRNATVEKP